MLHQLWLRMRSLMKKAVRRVLRLACRFQLLGECQDLNSLYTKLSVTETRFNELEKKAKTLEKKAKALFLTNMLINKQQAKLKPDTAALAAAKSAAEAAANAAQAQSAKYRAEWIAMASKAMAKHSRKRDHSPGTSKRRRLPIPITSGHRRLSSR